MSDYQMYIDGQWCSAQSGETYDAINPALGESFDKIPKGGREDARRAIAAANEAFETWRKVPLWDRSEMCVKIAQIIDEHIDELADILCTELGKPRHQEAKFEAGEASVPWRVAAEQAKYFEAHTKPCQDPQKRVLTFWQPRGVVAAITPWNSPVMMAVWKIAPALAAGNTVVVKPSEHASTSTLELMEVFRDAGFPDGVVNTVTGFGNEVGEPLVSHPNVAKVTFTGSETGGRSVNRAAADNVRPVTLELGGKSPQIVFADGDIESAVNGVISGVFLSNGQTCVAGSRLFLQSEIAEAFLDRLKDSLSGLRMGDPFDPETQIGPIATGPQFEKILSHIEGAKAEGANCVIGGNAVDGPECGQGWFVEPTVFTDVASEMTIAREEVFGPVLAVMTFDDEDEAVRLANDTIYGLAAGIWTRDLARAHRLARRIQSGTVAAEGIM